MAASFRLIAAALLTAGVVTAANASLTFTGRGDTSADYNATWVAYSLQDRSAGTVIGVEPSGRDFVARIVGGNGYVRQVTVSARTGEVTDDVLERRLAVKNILPVAAILPAIAETGWYDVRSVTLRDGVYDVKTRNDNGKTARIKVDAVTGTVFNGTSLSRYNGIATAG